MKTIAIGCDPNAQTRKELIIEHVKSLGYEVKDFGSEDPIYANVAIAVAEAVANKEYERGILICGTGIGVCIAANKVDGAYAALCSDVYSAERAQLSNNANIMTMGAFTTGSEVAKLMVTTYLGASYVSGGRSEPKVQRICDYEKNPAGK
ncbi:MAG: RpiB/LacA/LacB family sugar-phosphate isomerase [Sphaerochaetaceae bacterium]